MIRNSDIGKEWGIVERVVPGPTGNIFVVISANPVKCFNVTFAEVELKVKKLGRFYSKLFSVVFFFIVVKIVFEYGVVLQVVDLCLCYFV